MENENNRLDWENVKLQNKIKDLEDNGNKLEGQQRSNVRLLKELEEMQDKNKTLLSKINEHAREIWDLGTENKLLQD